MKIETSLETVPGSLNDSVMGGLAARSRIEKTLKFESLGSNDGWSLRYWMIPNGSGIDPQPAPFGTARKATLAVDDAPLSLVATPPIPSLHASNDWAPAGDARIAPRRMPASSLIRLYIGGLARFLEE